MIDAATIILLSIFGIAAALCLYAAATGAPWFFNSPGSILRTLPRPAARIIAAIIALAILTMAAIILHDSFPSLS
ncbi:MAG: hypothetical protein HDS11_01395 [Bacteroides sp.]|nr:hypothetical protein [Bacteroides sp.]